MKKSKLLKVVLLLVLLSPFIFLVFNNQILTFFGSSTVVEIERNWLQWFEREYVGEFNEQHFVRYDHNSGLELIHESIDVETHIISDGSNHFEIEDARITLGARPASTPLESLDIPKYWQFDSPQDVFYIEVWNHTMTVEMPILLKLFYNYQEVEYKVTGSTEYKSEFIFVLSPSSRVFIPITLSSRIDSSNHGSRLGAAVFLHPEKHAINNRHIFWDFSQQLSMFLDFEIQYASRTEIQLPNESVSAEEINYIVGRCWSPIIVSEGLLTRDRDIYAIESLQTRKGERVELVFNTTPNCAGLREATNEFLILGLLDWQQVKLNDKPYLFFYQNPERYYLLFSDNFYFYAPEESGLHEFVLILVRNPRRETNWDNFTAQDISLRMTIEVIDEEGN